MSTRPRTPGHGAPGPGKLPITELLGMKESHSPIAMITAYDAPSGRLADAAGADMILVGDSAAMTMLGHDSTVPATMEEMLVLTRAVTRGAKRPLVVADMPFGSFQISDELAVDERRPLRQGCRRGRREARRRGHDALPRPRDRRCGRARDGPHRPHAAVGDGARRLQGPGPHRVEGGAARSRCARPRGRRLLLDRPRGCPVPGGRQDHRAARDSDDRDRRGRRRRRPGARVARPPRPVRRPRATLREAVRAACNRDPAGASRSTSATCASDASPRKCTPTGCRPRSSRRSRRSSGACWWPT